MKLYLPVIYSIDSKWFVHALESEVPDVSSREAPLSLEIQKDNAPIRYRTYQGRLYSRSVEYPDPREAARLEAFRDPARAVTFDTQKVQTTRHPFFSVYDSVPFIGTHSDYERREISQESLAATRMGRVVADIASHSILVDGQPFRETTGPVVVRDHVRKQLAVVGQHVVPYSGYLAFALWDQERIADYCRRVRAPIPHFVVRGELPKHDPVPRMFECMAEQIRDHAFKNRINDLTRDEIVAYYKLETTLRNGWRGTPANEGGPPVWPHQSYDSGAPIAAQVAAMIDEMATLYPLRYGHMKEAIRLAKDYVADHRIWPSRPLGPGDGAPELADLTF